MSKNSFTKKQLSEALDVEIDKAFNAFKKKLKADLLKTLLAELEGKETTNAKGKAKGGAKGKAKGGAKGKAKGKGKGDLKEKIQKAVSASRAKSQAYYEVEKGKAYVITAAKKKTHDYFDLGDGLYVAGEKGSAELAKVLEDLGFKDAEPLDFTPKKAPPPKKAAKKQTPKKQTPKKKSPKKVEKPELVHDNAFRVMKDSKGYVYFPGETYGDAAAFGKLKGEKVVPLTKKDVRILEKEKIPLWHQEEQTDIPDSGVIEELLQNYRNAQFGADEKDEKTEDSETEDEKDSETEDEETQEMSEGSSGETSSEESGKEDGDIVDESSKAIEEMIEPASKSVTEEDYEKYLKFLQTHSAISNVRKDAEKMGLGVEKLRAILADEKVIEEQFKAVKEKLSKARKQEKRKKVPSRGRTVLDVN